MVVFAVGAGMVWDGDPRVLHARSWGTNETLFTLMMNYVATQLVSFAITFWENPVGSNTVGIINSATSGGLAALAVRAERICSTSSWSCC